MLTTIVQYCRLVIKTNALKNRTGTNFPPQKAKKAAGAIHKEDNKTECIVVQWNSIVFTKREDANSKNISHLLRWPPASQERMFEKTDVICIYFLC